LDAPIARPEVALRWIAAAAIAGAALWLRRASSSRSWVLFWLIVILLHLLGPAGAVMTQAIIAATPLLLLLAGATMAFARDSASQLIVDSFAIRRADALSSVLDRAPPCW
jgi:hypothetical protein